MPGIGRRLASMLYEALLLVGVLVPTFLLPHLAIGFVYGQILPGSILFLHVFLVLGAYFLWHWRHGGQTLAMKTWQLQIRSADDSPAPLSRLVLRYLISWPSVMFYGVGLFWALADRERQFLHDRLAGTCIVLKR